MSSEAPWSVKGVDSETRQQLKAIAQETGVTLGELIATLAKQQLDNAHGLKSPLDDETQALDVALEKEVKTARRKTPIKAVSHTRAKTPAKPTARKKAAPKAAPKAPPKAKAKATTAKKPATTHKKTTAATASKAAPKTATRRRKSAPKATAPAPQKTQSVFDTLLNKTQTPRRNTAKASVSIHKIPTEELNDIVVEGRELRDALRAHTKELSQDIQRRIEKSISVQIADLKSIVSHNEKADKPLPTASARTEIFLEEAQNLINQSLSSHLSEVKDIISAQNVPAENNGSYDKLHHEMQTMMEKVGQDILNSVDDKILALQSNGQADGVPVQALHNSLNSIIERLVSLETTCDNLQRSKQHVTAGHRAEFETIHQELSQFMQTVPAQVKDLLANSDQNIQSLNSALTDLAHRVENVESYAQKIPMPQKQEKPQAASQINNTAQHASAPSPAPSPTPSLAQSSEDDMFEEVAKLDSHALEELAQEEASRQQEALQRTAQPQQAAPQAQAPQAAQHNPFAEPQQAAPQPQTPQMAQHNPFAEPQQTAPQPQTPQMAQHNPFAEPQQTAPQPQQAAPQQQAPQMAQHNPFIEPQPDAESYYDEDEEHLQSLEDHDFEDEDHLYDDEEDTLEALDAWDEEAERQEHFDELGFEQTAPLHNRQAIPPLSEKKNDLNNGIKAIDYQAMMSRTRRAAINQLDQRALDERGDQKAKHSKIIAGLQEKTNSKNAMIVGAVALAIIILLTMIYLTS